MPPVGHGFPRAHASTPDSRASLTLAHVTRTRRTQRQLHSIRQRAHSRLVTRVIWRVAVAVIGLTFLAAGIGMLVLPGPGWAAIILGLVVLASEFPAAQRALEPIRRAARRAAARAMNPAHRARNLAVAVVLLVVIVIGSAWALEASGMTVAELLERWDLDLDPQ